MKRVIGLFMVLSIFWLFSVNIFANSTIPISNSTTAMYGCSGDDSSCYYTDGVVLDNYLYAFKDQYGIDIFSVSGDNLNLLNKNILDIKPLGAFTTYENYIITGTNGQNFIAIIDVSNRENPVLKTKIILENRYNTVLSLSVYGGYLYIYQYGSNKIYFANFNNLINSGAEVNITNTTLFHTVDKKGPFFLVKNFLVVPYIAGAYNFYNLDEDNELNKSSFSFTPEIDVSKIYSLSNKLVVTGISYTAGGGKWTYIYNFNGENNIELVNKFHDELKYVENGYFYSTSNSSDYKNGYIDFYNENLEKVLQIEFSYDSSYPGILMNLIKLDSSHVIGFFGTNGIRILKIDVGDISPIDSENNCSYFDANLYKVVVPCLEFAGKYYKFNLNLFATMPEIILNLDTNSISEIYPDSTEECATFDAGTYIMSFPCLKVGDSNLYMDLYLFNPEALEFNIKDYHLNN